MRDRGNLFEEVFFDLKKLAYSWDPKTPEQLVGMRKRPMVFSPVYQLFGLGNRVSIRQLVDEGISKSVAKEVSVAPIAVSNVGHSMIAHNHWPPPPQAPDEFVYFGRESVFLLERLLERRDFVENKHILDIGTGSGCLLIGLFPWIKSGTGIDICRSQIEWAKANASASLGPSNGQQLRFMEYRVGSEDRSSVIADQSFDAVVFNPPMIIGDPEKKGHWSYRDGGPTGIELPMLFLDFARKKLRRGGQVFALMTNPILPSGESLLIKEVEKRPWELKEFSVVEAQFNSNSYRSQEFKSLGLRRTELVFVHLEKRG